MKTFKRPSQKPSTKIELININKLVTINGGTDTEPTKHLIGHELTHTIQQGGPK